MNQSAGDAGYKYLTASPTIAYSGIRFGQDKNQQLTINMQFGLLSIRFDPTKFQFGDQCNAITGYNPGIVSAGLITKTSSSVFDIGAGVSYADGSPDKKINLFGGVATFHLNKPADPFVNTGSNDFLPARYTVQLGGRVSITDRLSHT
jgi:hypothetical protein